MPESQLHAGLVQLLTDCIAVRHARNSGICVFADTSTARRGEKPRPVNGFVPDVLAITVPQSFTIIGEAKSYADLDTVHSRFQVRAFLDFLKYSPDPRFMLAVPASAHASAFSLLRTLKHQVGADRVPTEIITPATWLGRR